MRWSGVLFDLDGTIAASGPIILECLAQTLTDYGYPKRPEELTAYVGPPLWVTFRELTGQPDDRVQEMVLHYRRIYDTLIPQTPVFPGLPELLDELDAAGVPLAIATSKKEESAVKLLECTQLDHHFVAICGASPDETRSAKADIIADATERLRAAGHDVSRLVMVGDRHHDIDGATRHGLPAILVSWGYAQPGEGDNALATVTTAADLRGHLLS